MAGSSTPRATAEHSTTQRVRRAQRDAAAAAWAECFGDEPLPQFATAAEWTKWVLNERKRTSYSESGEVRAPGSKRNSNRRGRGRACSLLRLWRA